jgi:hypothetical protein
VALVHIFGFHSDRYQCNHHVGREIRGGHQQHKFIENNVDLGGRWRVSYMFSAVRFTDAGAPSEIVHFPWNPIVTQLCVLQGDS